MKKIFNSELDLILSNMPKMNLNPNRIQSIRNSMKEASNNNSLLINESISISNKFILSSDKKVNIRLRIYQPKEKTKDTFGLLWFHGGGFALGIPEQDDFICQRFVLEANCVVVSVDYRLAPENPFPTPLEDCYEGLKWFSENSNKLGISSSRIAVAGVSAGGCLAAAVSLLARDRKGPLIEFQMPLYPMLDNRNTTPSSYEILDRRIWNREENLQAWSMYLGSKHTDDVSPYAAPSHATDLSGLPPTYICIGDLDPLRDEVISYVTRLSQAGVPTEFHLYPGCFHGFDQLSNIKISKRASTEYIQALKRAMKNE